MNFSKMNLSIIIPAYNEEKRIIPTIEKIKEYLLQQKSIENWEIIIIDDGSKDNTRNIANEAISKDSQIKINPPRQNRGKGFSVKEGMLQAKYDLKLFSDADLSTPIEMLDRFIPYLEDYDIIIGSRSAEGAEIKIKQPWYRSIPGKVFPLLVRTLILRGVKDTQCGFKLFQYDAAQFLFQKQRLDRFSFDAELLYLAKKYNYKIKEVPVVWVNVLDSKLNPIKDSYRMFMELLKIKINDFKGAYK